MRCDGVAIWSSYHAIVDISVTSPLATIIVCIDLLIRMFGCRLRNVTIVELIAEPLFYIVVASDIDVGVAYRFVLQFAVGAFIPVAKVYVGRVSRRDVFIVVGIRDAKHSNECYNDGVHVVSSWFDEIGPVGCDSALV